METAQKSNIKLRILVRCPNWIGDQVLAYPFFYLLREKYPHAHIAAICRPWVKSIQFKSKVDEVFELPVGDWKNLFKSGRMIKKKGPWDLAFSLPNSFSAALHLFLCGARVRIGYGTDGRSFLLNRRLRWSDAERLHRSKAYSGLLEDLEFQKKLFFSKPADHPLDPKNVGILEDFDAVAEWNAKPLAALGSDFSADYVVFAPGATAESRRWPVSFFKQLAALIQEKWKVQIVVVGGKAELPLAQELASLPGIIDFTNRTLVSDLYSLFRNAKFTVCNESGLAHLSALSGAMTQIVCGAADPKRTEPIGPGRVQVSFNPVDCWPCERNVCLQPVERKIQCLMGIQPERVLKEISYAIDS